MIDLMVDLETLGTRPGSVILSLAAVPFNTAYALEPFYVKISSRSCLEEGLTTDARTIAWWEKQSKEAYDEAFSGTVGIIDALNDFSEYCAALPAAPMVWGNGADFDNVLLAEVYNKCGIRQPWKYTDSRCYRTLKNLFPQVPYIQPKVKHNALQDASAQAQHAERIHQWLHKRDKGG